MKKMIQKIRAGAMLLVHECKPDSVGNDNNAFGKVRGCFIWQPQVTTSSYSTRFRQCRCQARFGFVCAVVFKF